MRLPSGVVANLGYGALLGIGATLAVQHAANPAHPSLSVERADGRSFAAVPPADRPRSEEAETSAESRPPGGGPSPRSTSNWERVAALLATPGGDPSLARSLMLRLDEKALRKLAADVAGWPRGRRSQRVLGEVFHRWGELDPSTALAQAQTLVPDLAYVAVRESLDGYAESDPAGASAYLAAPPAAGTSVVLRSDWTRAMCLGHALQDWAEQDAAAAVGFASRLPPDAYRSYVLDGVAQEWMRQDPVAALNWAQNLRSSDGRTNALSGAVTAWAQTDPAQAANYVVNLSGSPGSDDLVKTLATTWSEQDAPAAARWAAQQSGSVQTKAAAAVAETWADLDPLAAADWSSQFPAGNARDEAWAAIAKSWYISDPAATQNWISSLPSGGGRDAAIVGATEYWSLRNQPAEILGIVGGISDAQVRANTMISVLNGWLERDHPAAQQWIGQANLPATVVGKLKGG